MPDLFNIKMVFTQIPRLLEALPVTLEMVAIALVIGFALGAALAVIRIAKIPVLTQIAVFFVSLMRGTPIIVQLYTAYFGVPILLRYINYYNNTDWNLNKIPGIVYAIIALGLNSSAFNSETIRSAILSVDKGQIEAARSMGMSEWQVFRRVIFPQAIEVALLPLGNAVISLIKGTSLAFTCGVVEMAAVGKIIAGRNYRYFEVYLSLGIIYWILTILIERVIKLVEKKIRVPEEAPTTEKAVIEELKQKYEIREA